VNLADLGSELETCVGSRVRLVGVFISFEKNFYRLPFTPPSPLRRFGPSSCCSQLLWITNTMSDFSEEYTHVPLEGPMRRSHGQFLG
jgi:hypothetical protein